MLKDSCQYQHWMPIFISMLAICSNGHAYSTGKVRTRVIAQSGETAPSGLGLNLSIFKLETLVDATINNRGDVVYRALTNQRFQQRNRVGLWIDPSRDVDPDRFIGILDFVPAPGAPSSQRFRGVSLPFLSDSGNSLATEFLDDDSRSSSGIWLANNEAVLPVLVPSQQAPGLDPGELIFNAVGVAYTAGDTGLLSATTNQDRNGMWRFSNGQLELLAINRTSIPELPGFAFTGEGFSGRINDVGTAVIRGRVTSGGLNQDALFHIAPGGSRSLIALSGSGGTAVPGAPLGSTFSGIHGFRINDAGTISIDSYFRTPSGELGVGVWLQKSAEELQPIVITGMMTPNGDAVFQLNTPSDYSYNLNELGQFGFTADLTRGTGDSIGSAWIGSLDGLELLAEVGDQAPGLASGVVFGGLGMPQLNDLGTIFLPVELAGPGISNGMDAALFYRTSGDELRPLIWSGQLLELFPGDSRRVVYFDSPLAEAGRAKRISNRNEAVITVTFDDGSTAVVVFAIVPEPTTALLMVGVIVGLFVGQRRELSLRA